MPVERALWAQHSPTVPHFRCPRCKPGRLAVIPDSINRQTPDWTHDEDDPDIIMLDRFVMMARCNNPACGEVVGACGTFIATGNLIIDLRFPEGDPRPEEVYEIAAMHPAPPMIEIPDRTPEAVRADLVSAFEAFWRDKEGCVGKLRGSAEKMLDDFGVARTVTGGGFLSFRERIDLVTHARVKPSWLHAMRKVGNLGTHGEVTDEDLFNAMDMWEIVLEQAYGEDREARADNLAKLLST